MFVVMVNAWMNTPTGITLSGEAISAVDPIAGMFNPSTSQQVLHMLLAAYAATGLAVAGIHAGILIRRRESAFHRAAFTIALAVGAPAAILQPISGDLAARTVAKWQPIKLAALEGQFATERGAPLRIGGVPSEREGRTRLALEIPRGLSLLAYHDPSAEVKGLTAFPRDLWPPVAPVHVGFQVMVGLGTIMALASAWALFLLIRRKSIVDRTGLLRLLAIVTPFGFIATEAGWTVTEVGRQPWVVQGVLRTADAVTPMPGLVVPMTIFALLYLGLGAIVVTLIRSLVRETT
jgi:cytochrome d ubiquinol oxidase subunit I